ncbi:MAG: Ornithine cyclodeaminase [Chloroflexi bacterium]|nr:Ornithine cyclodeaminase [Chloroflexota bacterium]
MLILNDEEARKALPLRTCMLDAVDAVEEATRIEGRGGAALHPRIALNQLPDHGRGRTLVTLPGIVENMGAAVRFYGTLARGGDGPRQTRPYGATAVFDYADMAMVALIEDGHLNVVRTGAPTGVAIRNLANPEAGDVAMLGSGELAPGQLAAVCAVRKVRRVRVYSPTAEHREAFAREMTAMLNVAVEPCSSAPLAVQGADIVLIITSASSAVLDRAWLEPGATVVSCGTNEVDAATILDSRVFTDSLARTFDDPSREPFATLRREGRISEGYVTELKDVLTGSAPGRQNSDELVTFCSAGSALWDVAVPMVAYRRARDLGIGIAWP